MRSEGFTRVPTDQEVTTFLALGLRGIRSISLNALKMTPDSVSVTLCSLQIHLLPELQQYMMEVDDL